MRLTHPQYVKLVFRTYQVLRSAPEFSPALKQPTPASVRSECLTVYKERPDKKDEPVLRSFFGPAAENNSFSSPIENIPTVRFKAFTNYLNGKAVNTDDKNVELLAWLIGFPHRPFRFGMDVILNETEKAILNGEKGADPLQGTGLGFSQEIEDEDLDICPDTLGQSFGNETTVNSLSTAKEQVTEAPIDQQIDKTNTDDTKGSRWIEPGKKDLQKKNKWIIVGIALFITILSIGVYLLYDKNGNCMYWTGDHYERIDCDAEVNDKVVFNEERWKIFRKITDLSTITEKSIGVVHYYGNKNREFFTCGGKHPIDNTRYLKVMTRYIWEKEFGPKDSVTKNAPDEKQKPAVNQY